MQKIRRRKVGNVFSLTFFLIIFSLRFWSINLREVRLTQYQFFHLNLKNYYLIFQLTPNAFYIVSMEWSHSKPNWMIDTMKYIAFIIKVSFLVSCPAIWKNSYSIIFIRIISIINKWKWLSIYMLFNYRY